MRSAWLVRRQKRHGNTENQIRERTLTASTIAFPHIPFQSVQHKNPRKQMVLANRQQNDCAISLPTSRIKFLSTGENAYNPTWLRDNVHHGLDSRRSLHHRSPSSSPAAAMVVVVVVVVMVLGWSTIFWRHATIRARGYFEHGDMGATGPMRDERTCHTWFMPVLLRKVRCR